MKKDYSILSIVLSIVLSACSIGIDILNWRHFPALYLAGLVVGSIAFVISVVCLVLRLKKYNGEEKYYKVLILTSMIPDTIALLIPAIGELIVMFM